MIDAGTCLSRAGRASPVVPARSARRCVAHLDVRPLDTPHRPAVDVLFQSAAEVYGARVLGVVMTGMGADGREGAAWIKARGGQILTEAEQSCVVYGMPRSVVEAGLERRNGVARTTCLTSYWRGYEPQGADRRRFGPGAAARARHSRVRRLRGHRSRRRHGRARELLRRRSRTSCCSTWS